MSYADKSRARDFDQHASKIRLGLEKLKSSDAKRAIWELFQNAVDFSKECHIRIEKTSDGFRFEHDGKPFLDDSLASLIKQVTNKEQGTQEDSVGQYGTGFITTHIYGKKIMLNGYAEAEGGFIELKDFLIDRTEDESIPLSKKIDKQDKCAAKRIDEANDIITKLPHPCWTSFGYIVDSEQNTKHIKAAIDYLKKVLPVVFVFNDKLSTVEISYEENKLNFKKEKVEPFDGYWIVKVFENDQEKSFVCLFSDDEKKAIRIVLPYNSSLEPRSDFEIYPKLFLFYPLIGSENNGINFIVHANTFSPQEERDALYLEFDNDDIRPKVEASRDALEVAFSIIIKFLENNPNLIPNTLLLCKIFFKHQEEGAEINFWENKKSELVDNLLSIALIETNDGRKDFYSTCFFSSELLLDKECFDSIYSVVSQFYKNIPLRENIIEWSELTATWQKGLTFLTIENILSKIEEAGKLEAIIDKDSFKYFLSYVCKSPFVNLFDEMAVLPNIYGDFKHFSDLKEPQNIDEILVSISEHLFSEETERFVDIEYKIEKPFSVYTREDFKRNINEKAQEISDNIGDEEKVVSLEEIKALLDFISINTTTEINKKLSEHLSAFFEYNPKESLVDNHVKDFDYRSSLKALFRYFIANISKRGDGWLQNNLPTLTDALEIVYENDDFKKTVLNELKIYANQNYELCSHEQIKIDNSIPKELKDIYLDVLSEDYRDKLALVEMVPYLKGKEEVTPDLLGGELEKYFQKDNIPYSPIINHPEKDKILKILQYITATSNSPWGQWFPVLFSQRLEVLVGKIIEPAVQQSMFAILTKSDEMISLLGELAELANLDEIVQKGKDALNKADQARRSFKHKFILGKRIEDIIRERISSQINIRVERPISADTDNANEIEATEEQDGQDIIVFLNEKPIYYIEVKSRWNADTPFRISRNQTIRASDNAKSYALVSIDMTRSDLENPKMVEAIEDLLNVIKVNDDIGEKLDVGLVNSYKISKDKEEGTFYIDGDFRTYVPLGYIDLGKSLIHFENVLIEKINDAYAQSN